MADFADQAAGAIHVVATAQGPHAAGGEARGDVAVGDSDQAPQVNGGSVPVSGHVGAGPAAADGAVVLADQPAHEAVARNAAGRGRVLDGSVVTGLANQDARAVVSRRHVAGHGHAADDGGLVAPAGQKTDPVVARDARAGQREVADGGVVKPGEQPQVIGPVPVNEQVGDGVAVALEGGGEPGRVADGNPAVAAVPVGIAVVGIAADVGVEVEVGGQLVAGAYRPIRRVAVPVMVGEAAAHALRRVGEGSRVGGGFVNIARVDVVPDQRVAVRIVADGVQLGEAVHLDEAVVVAVVVGDRAGVRAGVLHRDRGAAGRAGKVVAARDMRNRYGDRSVLLYRAVVRGGEVQCLGAGYVDGEAGGGADAEVSAHRDVVGDPSLYVRRADRKTELGRVAFGDAVRYRLDDGHVAGLLSSDGGRPAAASVRVLRRNTDVIATSGSQAAEVVGHLCGRLRRDGDVHRSRANCEGAVGGVLNVVAGRPGLVIPL